MTDDHQHIRALFESGCAAWNRGDIDGYLADYWHSDKVRWVSEGTVRYGFEAIAAGFKLVLIHQTTWVDWKWPILRSSFLERATHWYLAPGYKLLLLPGVMAYSQYT